MKSELPRVGLVLQSEELRIMRIESSLRRVDAVNENFVQSGVRCDKKAIVMREVDRVAVHFGRRTSRRHTRAFPGMLVKARDLSEPASLPTGIDTELPLDQFATATIEPVLSRLRWHGITPLVEARFSSRSFPVLESMEKAVM